MAVVGGVLRSQSDRRLWSAFRASLLAGPSIALRISLCGDSLSERRKGLAHRVEAHQESQLLSSYCLILRPVSALGFWPFGNADVEVGLREIRVVKRQSAGLSIGGSDVVSSGPTFDRFHSLKQYDERHTSWSA